jgi:hypothetical protein
VTLLGYALFGKGWAYTGVPPVYVGELVLLGGVIWLVRRGNWHGVFEMAPARLVWALMVWGLLTTCPYLALYGLDSLRDAMIWGYSAFAIIVFVYLRTAPVTLAVFVHRYKLFTRIFLIAIPLSWVMHWYFPQLVPHWPWDPAGRGINPKAGEVCVHLAGILAFGTVGLGAATNVRALLLACYVPIMAAYERSGMLAFLAAFVVCLFHRRGHPFLRRVAAVWICGLVFLLVTDARFVIPNRGREVSFGQFLDIASSLTSQTGSSDLDDTKQWRLNWWSDIVDYTVAGEYFWTGKGFGINLADDDGYQGTDWDGRLRSPHNAHLTMLARAGVPGLLLWASVQLSWAWSVFAAYRSSRARGRGRWPDLFLFLFAYWLAFLVNASFDVFLEGPMAGIWFWTVYGTGLGAVWIYRHHPELLEGDSSAVPLLPRSSVLP